MLFRPQAARHARHDAGAGGAELGDLVAAHRAAEDIGLHLHERVVVGSATIHRQPVETVAEVALHRSEDVADLQCDRFQRGTGDLGPGGCEGQAGNGRAGAVIPMGGAEAGEGGNHDHAAVALGGLGKRGQRGDVGKTEEGHHPRCRLGGNRDVALKRVGRAGATAPGDGRRQAAFGEYRRFSHGHQRGAGAVGRLDLAGGANGVAEERGMGIAHDGVDGHARRQATRRGGQAEARIGTHRLRQDGGGHAEQPAQVLIPRPCGDIEKLRARGVAEVGGVDRTAGELEQQPGIDRAGAQSPGRRARPCRRVLFQQPTDLGRRKHRVEREAGLCSHHGFHRRRPQIVDALGRTAALPRHAGPDRLASLAVPHEDRLALVG